MPKLVSQEDSGQPSGTRPLAPEPTYLRAVLADYLLGVVSTGTVCRVWGLHPYEGHHALANLGLLGAGCTPENIEKLLQVLKAMPER